MKFFNDNFCFKDKSLYIESFIQTRNNPDFIIIKHAFKCNFLAGLATSFKTIFYCINIKENPLLFCLFLT